MLFWKKCIFISIAPWLYVPREMFGRICHLSTSHISVMFEYFTFSIKKGSNPPQSLWWWIEVYTARKRLWTFITRCVPEGPKMHALFSTHFMLPLKSVPLLCKKKKIQKWSKADRESCNSFLELLLTGPKLPRWFSAMVCSTQLSL